jgi:catechol 2,3-dioxygenase-like lactoylglutathione lyase family enzyme
MLIKKAVVTIYVSDVDAANKFYTETLGMKQIAKYGKEWAEVESYGVTIGLHPSREYSPKPGSGSALSIGFEVDDLDRSVTELKSKGVRFSRNINEDGTVRLAHFSDPDGNPLYLSQVKRGVWG